MKTSKFSAHSLWSILMLCFASMFHGAIAQVDENAPMITVEITPSAAYGIAEDARPSEDINGNGVLDAGEDLNGNAGVDVDSGIAAVELTGDVSNLELILDDFVPGDLAPIVFFSVRLEDESLPGYGLLLATDGVGNEASYFIELGPPITAQAYATPAPTTTWWPTASTWPTSTPYPTYATTPYYTYAATPYYSYYGKGYSKGKGKGGTSMSYKGVSGSLLDTVSITYTTSNISLYIYFVLYSYRKARAAPR